VYVYHPPLTTAFGPWLSRVLGGAPYVLHVQDVWPDSVVEADMVDRRSLGVLTRLLERACRAIYRRAATIICIAPTMAALLAERGIAAGRLDVVGNWADETLFFPAARDPELAEALGAGSGTSVMFAGNMGAAQALDTAVRAAAAVRDLADFRLLLVGDGVHRSRLEQLARDLQLTNVSFVGPRPLEQMNAITATADAQLVTLLDRPYLRGTIPSKLGSVMASGLPVVCAADGDAAALVEKAGAGWTCAGEDVEGLAAAFRAVHAASPAERQGRGALGRAHYEEHMAKATGVARIVGVLRRAAHA
jgi:glycosyltransferase involved in cell wall biosynthesis